MWECPNFFELDGKQLLIASPMDMEAEADEAIGSVRFPQGSNVCCIAGSGAGCVTGSVCVSVWAVV